MSKAVPLFHGKVVSGKMTLDAPDLFRSYLTSLDGKEISLSVWARKRGRSNDQNAWYWAAVIRIPADHFGYTPEEMHEAYKWMFLKKLVQGKPPTVGSTAALTTAEFTEFVERCRTWAATEYGIVIPDPDGFVLDNIVR